MNRKSSGVGKLGATRRNLLFGGVASVAAASSRAVAQALFVSQPASDIFAVAETAFGKVRGLNVAGIRTFRGISYGAPTSGQNRFMPPRKPDPWTGVRDAFDFGQISPQVILDPTADYISLIEWNLQSGGMGEDLLTLNVWTPGLSDGGKRPVMVSFHGGGFTTGSQSESCYNGDPLARFGNVVVVTVQHRLGALGYLDLADVGAPPEFAQAGVVGMLDLVQALEWVRNNIEVFGGDPDTVMIFGQSGGGSKTSTMLAMPAGKGLFHRAAVQSGSTIRLTSKGDASRAADLLLRELGLDRSRIAELQVMPWDRILTAQAALAGGLVPEFRPVVDGTVIPRDPFDPTAPDASANIPLIVSYCLNDAALRLLNFDLTDDGLRDVVTKMVGAEKAERVLDLYFQAYPNATPYQVQAAMVTDRDVHRRAVTQAERKAARNQGPVWMYRFDWPSPSFGGKFGSVHAVDVGLVFHNAHQPIVGNGPEGRVLADQMAAMWVAFAKAGDPNTKALPHWPPYTVDRRETLVINTRSRVVNDPGHDLRLLWDELGV